MNTSPILSVSDLDFAYNGTPVLTNLSFDVAAGSYVGIIGPNGGGKTTLLKIILGLLEPHNGHVSILGKQPAEARKHGRIGYIPQRATQLEQRFPATVLEVVQSGILRATKKEVKKQNLHNAMEIAGVVDLQHRLIHELSGGQRQRVFIARCLASKPRILVLDEPVTGVDTPSRDRFYALLKHLNTEHAMTVLFVTHDIDAIAKEVDQVLCINQTVCCHASPQDFLKKHVLDDLYTRPHA